MATLNRAVRSGMRMIFAATLLGWGNSEADQRKAFIAFLQDINNRPGIHFLVPTANDEKPFGPYLQHYTITIEQMAAAPADLTAAKDAVDKMEQGIETRLAKVNADRGALKQPGDLKVVYDRTFDKLITAPAVAFENSAKALSGGIDAALALVSYINAHRTKLVPSGMRIQAKDQRTLDELTPLMKAYQDAGERFVVAQRQSDRVLGGN